MSTKHLRRVLPAVSIMLGAVLSNLSMPAVALSSTIVSASISDDKTDAVKLRAEYIRKNYSKFEYRIPMRDGKLLFTAVYMPNDASASKRYPILMNRTPYSVAPYGADQYRTMLGPTADYEKEGFIFAFQDVRGTFMSEGEFVNMRPHMAQKKSRTDIDESSDTFDSIEWMLRHLPNNNGKFGQWGSSYPGFYASAGAIDGHPALKAISPQAPIADWFRGDDMHRNGAFNLQMAFNFFYSFGQPRPQPTVSKGWKNFNFGTPDGYQFFLDLGSVANANARHFKNGIPFWNEIIVHPNYDEFWQSRNILPHLKNIKAAVLTVGGWYDTEDLYGPLNTYKSIEKQNPGIQNTLVIGPWTHGGWYRTDGDKVGDTNFGYKTVQTYQPVELAFFKHYLKTGDKPTLAEAWMFETGANRWRGFDSWPPKESKDKALYFQANGKLSFSAPTNQEALFEEYVSDPAKPVPYTTEIGTRWSNQYIAADQRFASSRPDVLTWQSEVLEKDVTLAGPLNADLFVSVTGSDADFVVKLIDVNPPNLEIDAQTNRGNQQTLVRGEPFRARYRDGFETAKAMQPNQMTKVKFAINDVLHTFKRGHRIMVQVQSSWFPFIDRNPQSFVPNIYEARDSDFIKATHKVYFGSQQPSALHVKVLPALDE
ncbi:CocE/NonD family hydrolase [Undibacterium sp.]|uniref:CocE/NonD family hydrolase n=1 Tax=Undibacterium sp. TaxID=1914977 RepID=UPI0027313FC6|nr:CocE/NonD family hydrolase [Undibacterium sp.]MDP1978399.1 CocE/NonD family hydrolase [Undibacterium sp.]